VDYNQPYFVSVSRTDYLTEMYYYWSHDGDCSIADTAIVQVQPGDDWKAELDFGMTLDIAPWYQVVGGDVISYGGVNDPIPQTCDTSPGCSASIEVNSYSGLATFSENGVVGSAGVTNPGDGEVGTPNNWQVEDSSMIMSAGNDYADFYQLWQSDPNAQVLSGDQNFTDIVSCPVGNGQTVIRLVDGNLTVNGNCQVNNGGLLIVVVSGNITVNSDITELHGVFLADDNFVILGDGDEENQLVLEGSFAAGIDGIGGQVLVGRDLGQDGVGDGNADTPAVVFVYRPDFVVSSILNNTNYSEEIKWQEIP
jgi:hypothetical protein